jgi:carboxylesterase
MIWDFQDALTRRLLLWGTVSGAAGVVLLIPGDAFWRGFGLQALAWGAIDAAIALLGGRAARKRQATVAPGPETAQREGGRLRRLLWINTGLDVLYVLAGLGLVYTQGVRNPALAGTGWGIVVQGGFLFLFDLLHARAVPTTEPSMPALSLFGGPEHLPFLLPGGEPAALLVHGFGGTPAEMRALGESLNREGWTARGILLPGFGADLPTLIARRYGEWVAAVEAAAAELRGAGYRPLLLVGFSMGAAACLAAATAVRPDGLALLAPFWWEEKPGWRLADFFVRPLLPLSIRPLRKADFNNARLRQGISQFMGGVNLDDPQTQQAMRDLRVPLSLIDQVRGVSGAAYAAAAQVEAPTLVVQGTRDPVVRIPQTRKLMRRVPSMPHYVEVDAGHDLTSPENSAWPQVEGAVADFARNVGDLHSYQTSTQGKRSA